MKYIIASDGVLLGLAETITTLPDGSVICAGAHYPATTGFTVLDRAPAAVEPGRHRWTGSAWELVPPTPATPAEIASAKSAFIVQVDTDVDALIRAVIGERASEYERAEKEAAAFAAGGYIGTAPGSVSAWAVAKGWTSQAAADDIIATATAWRTAQAAIRANRLLRKEGARNAVDAAALATVKAQWAGFLTVIRGQLGL